MSPKQRKQMLANQAKLTYERLREVLRYEPETGECTWLASTGKRKDLIGKRACSLDKVDGYRRIKVDGVSYLSSRLAVFFITELWPDDEVDHKNTDPSNDRWENLREATKPQQNANTRERSRSGLPKGVWRNQRWGGFNARIKINRKQRHLGTYSTPEAAHAAYARAAERLHGEFARLQ